MRRSVDVAAPNSLILVMDPREGEPPPGFGSGPRVAATPSCVAVATFAQPDGTTCVSLGDEPPSGDGKSLVFDGSLQTPNGSLAVCTVLGDVLLRSSVAGTQTKLRVWTNHPTEPDEIDVVVLPENHHQMGG